MERKLYKIEYKPSSRSKRTFSGIQSHRSEADARELREIRRYNPEAVVVSVRELTPEEVRQVARGFSV